MSNFTKISQLISCQFPNIYVESGSDLVVFLQAYYEWLETTDQLTDLTRKLVSFRDIDTTLERFLADFRDKYINGLPSEIVGNQRLIQKHILELYRSKGSQAGIKLLFRLLYNQDVDIYVPSYDILRPSSGKWIEPKYIEIEYSDNVPPLSGKIIVGTVSGARAIVEDVHKKYINNRPVMVVYISHLSSTFIPSEKLIVEQFNPQDYPTVVGSVVGFDVKTTTQDFSIGDIVKDQSNTVDIPIQAVVNHTYKSTGAIEFTLVSGGTYYTANAVVSITNGTNTSGSGASIKIGSISNTFQIQASNLLLAPYKNVALNATTYGFATNTAANSSTILRNAVGGPLLTVGTIDSIIVTSPGIDYDGSVTVSITDPLTVGLSIPDSHGNIGGNNAIVTAIAQIGQGLVDQVKIIDSGIGYVPLSNNSITLKTANNMSISGTPKISGVGISIGFYDDSDGFLSEDKYLFDGYFYQNFSYVIRSVHLLEEYIDVLRATVHQAGTLPFGQFRFNDLNQLTLIQTDSSVVQAAVDPYYELDLIVGDGIEGIGWSIGLIDHGLLADPQDYTYLMEMTISEGIVAISTLENGRMYYSETGGIAGYIDYDQYKLPPGNYPYTLTITAQDNSFVQVYGYFNIF